MIMIGLILSVLALIILATAWSFWQELLQPAPDGCAKLPPQEARHQHFH